MAADVKLLPLPELPRQVEGYNSDYWEAGQIEEYAADYARANVAHATAALQAEIKALRAEVDAQQAEIDQLREQLRLALRDAAPAVQGEPVAYISQEDFEFLLSDDMSEQYGTRQAPVFSRKDYRVSVPLYASPQPPAQDVSALVEALEDIRSRSSMNLAMQPDQFELTARLGDIYQIADAALAKENSND